MHRPALLKLAAHSMKDDIDRELAIFTDAIKVPIQKRAAFLDISCRGDQNLRSKVEALLKAHDRIGNFLEEPPTGESIE
jgi:hypothetical protein